MKRMKSGFTLAEVLITLGIIGVVAAIVMPAVMTNYTYKTVGVKLQKFLSQTEGTSRPYVVSNEQFVDESLAIVDNFVLNSYLVTNPTDFNETETDCSDNTASGDGTYTKGAQCGTKTEGRVLNYGLTTMSSPINNNYADFAEGSHEVKLKDNTSFIAYMLPDYDEEAVSEINVAQVGEVVFGLAFKPNVNGLPKAAQKIYPFVVTELGYVYPDKMDDCMRKIAEDDYAVKTVFFDKEKVCHTETANEAPDLGS